MVHTRGSLGWGRILTRGTNAVYTRRQSRDVATVTALWTVRDVTGTTATLLYDWLAYHLHPGASCHRRLLFGYKEFLAYRWRHLSFVEVKREHAR